MALLGSRRSAALSVALVGTVLLGNVSAAPIAQADPTTVIYGAAQLEAYSDNADANWKNWGSPDTGRNVRDDWEFRWLVEFDVSGLVGCDVTTATLSLRTSRPDLVGQTRATFYAGDGAPTLARFAAPNGVGSILFTPPTHLGESYDVTSLTEQLLADGASHVGVLLQQDPLGTTAAPWDGVDGNFQPMLDVTCGEHLCQGKAVTMSGSDVTGTDGDDVILGTEGDDWIVADGGDDTICGLGGHDQIFGGEGDDIVRAGAGDDSVVAQQGVDEIYGGVGNDYLDTGVDADGGTVRGGEGNDELFGDDGVDLLVGGPGDDQVAGFDGADRLSGGAGADVGVGGDGDDFIRGGDGADSLHGQVGNDLINGNADDDLLHGGDGDDKLRGGEGVDTLDGGAGTNILIQ